MTDSNIVTCPITKLKPGQFVVEITKQTGNHKIQDIGWVRDKKAIAQLIENGILEVKVDTDKSLSLTPSADELKPTASPLFDELPLAKKILAELTDELTHAFTLLRQGNTFDLASLQILSNKFVNSCFRNSTAMLSLIYSNRYNDYQIGHALRAGVYLSICLKTLNWQVERVNCWVIGAFLHDIGKLALPMPIQQEHLIKTITNEKKRALLASEHIERGLLFADEIAGLSTEAIELIKMHHEKIDGSGFPTGEAITEMNEAVRLFSILNELETLTQSNLEQPRIDTEQAFRYLLTQEKSFDFQILQYVIKTIGIYPPGSLVILSSQKVAIVLDTLGSSLKPRVKLIYNLLSKQHIPTKIINLSASSNNEKIIALYEGSDLGNVSEQYL